MATLGPSRRVSKRRIRDVTQEIVKRKLVLGVDLNSPIETRELGESSGSVHARITGRTTVSVDPQVIQPVEQEQVFVPPLRDGLNDSIIDLDAIEDEVQMLSSSTGSPPLEFDVNFSLLCKARNFSSGNRPATVILDEDLDTNSRLSEESVTFSFRDLNRSEERSRNIIVGNCEPHPEEMGKGKNAMGSVPMPLKEPSFTCPICMNTLVEPSSTICGHIFCQSCIKACIKAHKKCPNCGRKLSMNNFHRVYLPSID